MPLLPRRPQIALQDRVDERNRRFQFRAHSFDDLPLFGHRIGQCFTHHAPMHAELPRYALDRSYSELILPPDGFE